jgi:hypothetical protein
MIRRFLWRAFVEVLCLLEMGNGSGWVLGAQANGKRMGVNAQGEANPSTPRCRLVDRANTWSL